jgi:hypothetical protein
MRATKVEESSPPMITQASGEYIAEFCNASGNRPPIAVALVSRIGRKRTSPARSIASSSGTPSARRRLVKSTSRIEFLVSMPISAMKPMVAVKEIVLPVRPSIRMPPAMPKGTTVSTMSVLLKLPNSSTRIATMPSRAMMSADCRLPKLSVRVSSSPPGTYE